jgi:hypothetical protein
MNGAPSGSERLSLDDLDRRSCAFDDAVSRSPALDRFCSSSLWVLPAGRHLAPRSAARIHARGGSYVALAQTSGWLHPLEAMWGLACPLVGESPEGVVELLVDVLEEEPAWKAAFLSGLFEGSPLWNALLPALRRRYELAPGSPTRRYVADLGEGVDGFLRRRTPGFRRNLERAERRARQLGIDFEVADGDPSFDRVLAVERRSWKGLRGVGIDNEPMRSFYRDIHERLGERGARRLTFAQVNGEDVAYILGGTFGDTYRGLQFSFDDRFAALSLGNLCQIHEVRRLSGTEIRRYDLGTEVLYKKRWGEEMVETLSLVVYRST